MIFVPNRETQEEFFMLSHADNVFFMLSRADNVIDESIKSEYAFQTPIQKGSNNLKHYPALIEYLTSGLFFILEKFTSALQKAIYFLSKLAALFILDLNSLFSIFIDLLVYLHSGGQHKPEEYLRNFSKDFFSCTEWFKQVCHSLKTMFTWPQTRTQQALTAFLFIPRLLTLLPLGALALTPVIIDLYTKATYASIIIVTLLAKNFIQLAALAVLNAPLLLLDASRCLLRGLGLRPSTSDSLSPGRSGLSSTGKLLSATPPSSTPSPENSPAPTPPTSPSSTATSSTTHRDVDIGGKPQERDTFPPPKNN